MDIQLFASSAISAVVRSRFAAIVCKKHFGVCILISDQQALSEAVALEKEFFLDLRVKM